MNDGDFGGLTLGEVALAIFVMLAIASGVLVVMGA